MVRIAVVSKSSEEAQNAASSFAEKLDAMGIENFRLIPLVNTKENELTKCEVVFSFGGDGTILKAARTFTSSTPLIIGVNYGHLGFLAEVDPQQVYDVLNKVLSGNYSFYIIRRMVMTLIKDDTQITSPPVMNDVYFSPLNHTSMLTVKVEVPDVFVYKGRMDGLLLSTALGSTAYSLSAGGPIVDPDNDVNIITPIAPINIALRPIVVSRGKNINIVNVDTQPISLTVDGVKWLELGVGEYVTVTNFEHPVKLYRTKTDLLKKLFDKRLSWNHSP